jgi:hypothetical protein
MACIIFINMDMEKIKILGKYQNGNYTINIYDDGTKIRETVDPDATEFVASFPESIDCKITNKCYMGCEWCHEDSRRSGKHGDVFAKFIDTLRPWTEIAVGGGNVLSHPDLMLFLRRLKKQKVIANVTLNQKHFLDNQNLIETLIKEKMIYGIGVSVGAMPISGLVEEVMRYSNAVFHVINGVTGLSELRHISEVSGRRAKVLVLGYKHLRRGVSYFETVDVSQKYISKHELLEILKNRWFQVTSFDNLALEQLEIKGLLSEERWNEIYMGDDGQHTMYMDLVERKFAVSSTAIERWDLTENIDNMFQTIKNYTKGKVA